MKVKNCPKCESKNFIKKGLDCDKQRYFCKDCNKYFQPKVLLPSWVKKAYNDYAFKSMILKDLSAKYNKSIPTLIKYFDILINKPSKTSKNNNEQAINLIFDATFFKR